MTPEEEAAHEAEVDQQLRDLATQIAQMTKLGFDPMTVRKGIITAVSDATTPPTVSLNISGDTGTLVSEVRTINNFTPLVGQTVLLAKQGTEIFLLGSIASVSPYLAADANTADNGWIKATISNGTHGGGGNDVYYRRILDHGSWKMQWRGVWNPTSATMIASADALDADYRPAAFRSVVCARNSDGTINIRMDFNADGTVNYTTGTPRITSTTISVGGSTDSRDTASTVSHNHGGAVATSTITHDDGFHSHGWSDSASHSHGGFVDVGAATWISLNGVEYFL